MIINIAIDGPAGAGKSTVAKQIANALSFIYVDTGAMYRAMALYMIQCGVAAEDIEGIEAACQHVDIRIAHKDGEQQVFLNGNNVTHNIRNEEVGNMASVVSTNKLVREKLVVLQQKMASQTSVVMDGRDIGTVVLPDAKVKIFLTASSKTRAKRRYEELVDKNISCDLNEIEQDIMERDNRDMNRAISPLRQADDAIVVDSSDMTIEEVVKKILRIYEERK